MIIKFIKDRATQIIFGITVSLIYAISFFLVEPKLEHYYLYEEIDKYFWTYYFITFALLLAILLVIWILNKTIKDFRLKDLFGIIILLSMFSLFYHPFTKDIILSINLIKSNESIDKSFKIEVYGENKIMIYNNSTNEIIDNLTMIKNINKNRILKGHLPIDKLKNGDTLKIEIKKGIFGIEYIK